MLIAGKLMFLRETVSFFQASNFQLMKSRLFWASLQLRRILDQTHISGIKKALANIPSEVSGIVKGALDMIKIQDPARAQLAIRTLALLTAPKIPITDIAPVTGKAMSHAMGISHVLDSNRRLSKLSEDEIPNPTSVIECCMGLVAIGVTMLARLCYFKMPMLRRANRNSLKISIGC